MKLKNVEVYNVIDLFEKNIVSGKAAFIFAKEN